MTILPTVLLLVASNLFMTVAWYELTNLRIDVAIRTNSSILQFVDS